MAISITPMETASPIQIGEGPVGKHDHVFAVVGDRIDALGIGELVAPFGKFKR